MHRVGAAQCTHAVGAEAAIAEPSKDSSRPAIKTWPGESLLMILDDNGRAVNMPTVVPATRRRTCS